MKYTNITKKHIEAFILIVGLDNIIVGDQCMEYGSDHTENLNYPPDIVLFPNTSTQVASILNYCNQHKIAITPSGSLTG